LGNIIRASEQRYNIKYFACKLEIFFEADSWLFILAIHRPVRLYSVESDCI